MQQLYLAATGMNRGKTTVALGLLAALIESGRSTGFIKPVGQRYAVVDGVPADEDAILMRSVFDLPDALGDLSPVHIPRGFTRAFIEGKVGDDLSARIRAAYARVADSRDVLLVEGTGHAGVGAVIGLSNAQVAAMLGTPALIVSEGGVGRPIDEIVLNRALFRQHGVPVAGAIVNKVDLDGHPGLGRLVRSGLAHHGIELLGVLPYRPILSNATLAMLLQQMPGKLLHAGPDPSRPIEHVAIAAMQARHVLERVGPGSLV
ncbi:MAG: AAA family ATPase, partial [Chloroflexi bacterium]|nr:AAA family ATPase [Chloroflexota bacterium]